MIGIGTALATIGIDFVKDLIMDNGEDLVKEGIKKVTGIDLTKVTPEKLTPEQIQKIKDSEVQLKELDFKEIEMHALDRASAREMQAEALRQDDLFAKRYVYYLATFWSITAALYIGLITFMTIPEDNIRFADTVLGFLLGTIISTIVTYFYGSSKGSKDKTSQLTEMFTKGK